MAVAPNPIASEHMPFFVTPPGQTDVLFNITMWFVLLCVIGLGIIFLTIHSLPERMAHKTKKVQLDIVAVLGLLALLTNEHVFWFAALILAFIDFPDFLGPVTRIARAVETMAGRDTTGEAAVADEPGPKQTETAEATRQIQKGKVHA